MLSFVSKPANNKVNMIRTVARFLSLSLSLFTEEAGNWPSVTYFPASLDLFNLDAKAISRAVIACQPHRGRF